MLKTKIGFEEALQLVMETVRPGPAEDVELSGLVGRILAEDVTALVDSPSLDVSLKDGYAVVSDDTASASPANPVKLKLTMFTAAGHTSDGMLGAGEAAKIMTGAPLPEGAEAVLAGEFAREEPPWVWCLNNALPGRNVLPRGADVSAGRIIARTGERLHPALVGLLAAAGHHRARVTAYPRVAVLATGDEVVAPGRPLPEGKLYASNIVETLAWLNYFGFNQVNCRIVPDRAAVIAATVREMLSETDAFITSGGSWGSEKDLIIRVLDDLGWQGVFHRVRLGPGKAAGLGLLEGRPFFILPGGPPSHEIAFLLLALPGLLRMAGWPGPVFPETTARLTRTVEGQDDWTQCLHARIETVDGELTATPLKSGSRLTSMARKDGFIIIPEGVSELTAGTEIKVVRLSGI